MRLVSSCRILMRGSFYYVQTQSMNTKQTNGTCKCDQRMPNLKGSKLAEHSEGLAKSNKNAPKLTHFSTNLVLSKTNYITPKNLNFSIVNVLCLILSHFAERNLLLRANSKHKYKPNQWHMQM